MGRPKASPGIRGFCAEGAQKIGKKRRPKGGEKRNRKKAATIVIHTRKFIINIIGITIMTT